MLTGVDPFPATMLDKLSGPETILDFFADAGADADADAPVTLAVDASLDGRGGCRSFRWPMDGGASASLP